MCRKTAVTSCPDGEIMPSGIAAPGRKTWGRPKCFNGSGPISHRGRGGDPSPCGTSAKKGDKKKILK